MSEDPSTRTIHLSIGGMGCQGCVTAVQEALQRVPGVERALVDLSGNKAEVEAAPSTEPQALVAAVEEAGYEASLR